LGTGAWWVLHNASQNKIALTQQQRFRNDIDPGKNAAVLTLAGGKQIVLDSTARGAITRQGNTTIRNANGLLVYNELHEKPTELLFNTLATGRGNQYQLILPDGSKVWLNAASSITYPTAFVGAERKVSITGEAYFEIAKNEKAPFIVESKDVQIQVLGTHFNVNTYDDEDALKTTLLEGSIKVGNSILRPGQQAILSRDNTPIKLVDHPDIDEVMAWKNGAFKFNDATIESIMRQMARWYDVEVVYDTRVSQHFIADVPRDVPASELLKLLELTDQVHFKIEGKKITVIR
jgi:ferric-dicitrate binding protein FerR (iron transport regulator)